MACAAPLSRSLIPSPEGRVRPMRSTQRELTATMTAEQGLSMPLSKWITGPPSKLMEGELFHNVANRADEIDLEHRSKAARSDADRAEGLHFSGGPGRGRPD